MKNRILVFVVAFVIISLVSTEKLLAQKKSPFTLNAWRNWMQVDSYNGVIAPRALSLQVQTTNAINQTDWYINVRILDSEIDQSKIRLILNSIDVDGGGDQLRDANYGAIYPLGSGDTRIITSNQSLNNNVTYTFIFDVEILGGDHLLELTLGKTYDVGFMFSAYTLKDENFDTFVEKNLQPKLPVRINDALTDIPMTSDFEFEVYADASLNFNVPEDYTRKVESSEVSWVKVTSKDKGYTVNVQTSDSYFEGESDIPVGVVSMQVEDKIGSRTGPEIALKNSGQTVFNGNATGSEPRKLDVRYFISPDNAKGLAIYKPGNYVTRLTYTLLPQ